MITKKKQRTPEQIKNRFYFAVGAIAFMLGVVLFAPKPETTEPVVDTVKEAMDNSIDTLVASHYGEDAEIVFMGKYEKVDALSLKTDELERAEENLELIESLSSTKDTMRIHTAREKVKQLREERDSLTTEDGFYTRRLRIKTGNGKLFTGYQKINTGLTLSQLINMIEIIVDQDKQKKEIEQTIKEIEK